MTATLLSPVQAAESSPCLEWGRDVQILARSSDLRGLEGLRALCCCSPVLGALAGSQPCEQSRVVQSPALVQLEQKEISSGPVLCSWRQQLALNRLMQQGEQLRESSDCTESGDGCGSLSLPTRGWH